MRLMLLFLSNCLSLIFALPPPTVKYRKNSETSAFFKYLKYQEEFDPIRKKKILMPKVEGKCHHLFIDAHDWTNVFKPHPIPYQLIKLQAIAQDEALFKALYKQLHSIVSLLEEEKGNEPPLAEFNELIFSLNFDFFFAARLLQRYTKDFRKGVEHISSKLQESRLQNQWNVITTILEPDSPCTTIYNQMKLFLKPLALSNYKNEFELRFFTTHHYFFNQIHSVLSKFKSVQHLAKYLHGLIPTVVDFPCNDALVLGALTKIRYLLQEEFDYIKDVQEEIDEGRMHSLLVKDTLSILLKTVSSAFHSTVKLNFQALNIKAPDSIQIISFFWDLGKDVERTFCKQNIVKPSRPVATHEFFPKSERPSSASYGPRVYDQIYDFFMTISALFIKQ